MNKQDIINRLEAIIEADRILNNRVFTIQTLRFLIEDIKRDKGDDPNENN